MLRLVVLFFVIFLRIFTRIMLAYSFTDGPGGNFIIKREQKSFSSRKVLDERLRSRFKPFLSSFVRKILP